MAIGTNNYGMGGSYVPPAAGGMAPGPMNYGAGPTYGQDQYAPPGGQYAPMPGQPGVQPKQGPNLMMVAGLAIAGFMLFGPVGAIVGGLIGLFMGGK
ncbi:MAG: hypothetical protein H7338_18275 [Candidatus Sericytochromatia bacterium]|nr:hypothetical protein [Candidatus Sericytochromatia bacterium]